MRLPSVVILLSLVVSCSVLGQTYSVNTVAGGGSSVTYLGTIGDGGPATLAQLAFPRGVAVDAYGNIYIADTGNNRIRKVSNGVITTMAGNGTSVLSGDGVPATSTGLPSPSAIAVDASGNLYVNDDQWIIHKVSNGVITTVAGGGSSLDDYVPATSAQLQDPSSLAVDSAGNLYIADTTSNRVRKVSSGVITTVAGNGTAGFSGDGGPATLATLSEPAAVAVDSNGNLYIGGNDRVREVSNGVINTIAGGGSSLDNVVPATSAQLDDPTGIAVDLAGNVYIVDNYNFMGGNRICKLSNGVITTIAGNGTEGFSGDGGPATLAQFNEPFVVAVDSIGNLYIADAGDNRIRILRPAGASCAYSVGPTALQAPATGGTLTVSIQTAASCSWIISGFPSWVTVPGATFGTGSTNVSLMVAPNLGAPLNATFLIAGVSVTITQPAAPLPMITAVLNAASFHNGPISPGEIVTLSGTALGPTAPVGLTLDQSGKVATLVSGVQVLFAGTPAPLTYVSSTQINCVAPYEIQGLVNPSVQLSYQGQTSSVFVVRSAPTVPALFTANGSGTGPAAASNEDGSYNSPNNPALKGSVVVLYMTGEGQTTPAGVTGQVTMTSSTPPLTPQPLLPVAVFINGQQTLVAFYGEAPDLVSGVMQLNVEIPANVPAGNLPVSVSVGGNSSQNNVTISVR